MKAKRCSGRIFFLIWDGSFVAAMIVVAFFTVVFTAIPDLRSFQFIGFGLIGPYFAVVAAGRLDSRRTSVLTTLPLTSREVARTLMVATLLAGPMVVLLSGILSSVLFGSHHWFFQTHLVIPFVLSLCSCVYLLLQSGRIENPVPVLLGPFLTILVVGFLLLGAGWKFEATGFPTWFHVAFPPLCLLSVLPSVTASKSWRSVPVAQWESLDEEGWFSEAGGDGGTEGLKDAGIRPGGIEFQTWMRRSLSVHPAFLLGTPILFYGVGLGVATPPHFLTVAALAVVFGTLSLGLIPRGVETLPGLPIRTLTRTLVGPALYFMGAIGFILSFWWISKFVPGFEGGEVSLRFSIVVLAWGCLLALLRFLGKDSPWGIIMIVLFLQFACSGSLMVFFDRLNPLAIGLISLIPVALTLWGCYFQVTKGSRRRA